MNNVTDEPAETMQDADVPRWWTGLGLPGLIDIHTHFLPERMLRRVWAHFDEAGPLIGRPWPITYRTDEAGRLDRLRQLGLRHFTALTYAHRPGMAADLTDFALELAAAEPDCVPSATFFPEDGVLDQVQSALARGARVFKIHAQVGGFDLREPVLDPVWGLLAEAGVPVVVHVGSGPVPRPGFTGPDKLEGVLRRHPRLTAVVAHMGAPEYGEFLDLAERYPQVHLDTTMVFTDFFEAAAPFPPELLPRLAAMPERIVLGSDFPNIPYAYAHQLEALERLRDKDPRLDDDWLRAVCWFNGQRLLGV
ncbi:amidohydrolase family protein [Arthrobacter sp. PsM3]|uniref:amidohydrolase family protein n=1 Tax=Arthrobacter sp. PsM3 TaxID=3030531 RepID=UPI00263AE0FB|nr:amidohydrolase family protein [Arthrobacter sp. PsM3]MDN4644370.1 amidohydrolase family protein [Arthrobacter sp. PsM3]